MSRLLLLAVALAAALCAAEARFYACKWSDTYRAYAIVGTGSSSRFVDKVRGDFVGMAYKQAVAAATRKLRATGKIQSGCKLARTIKYRGCYDSIVPGSRGIQSRGRYGFKYYVAYTCPGIGTRDFLCRVRLHTMRSNRPGRPAFWQAPAVQCLGDPPIVRPSPPTVRPSPPPPASEPTAPEIVTIGYFTQANLYINAKPPSFAPTIASYNVYASPGNGGAEVVWPLIEWFKLSNSEVQIRPLGSQDVDAGSVYSWRIEAVYEAGGVGPKSAAFDYQPSYYLARFVIFGRLCGSPVFAGGWACGSGEPIVSLQADQSGLSTWAIDPTSGAEWRGTRVTLQVVDRMAVENCDSMMVPEFVPEYDQEQGCSDAKVVMGKPDSGRDQWVIDEVAGTNRYTIRSRARQSCASGKPEFLGISPLCSAGTRLSLGPSTNQTAFLTEWSIEIL